eukprot:m.198723 g.198723  ORF g.198723 m.198723 type:complete len:99 (-) comp14923_c0_seq4:4336-4632(-)
MTGVGRQTWQGYVCVCVCVGLSCSKNSHENVFETSCTYNCSCEVLISSKYAMVVVRLADDNYLVTDQLLSSVSLQRTVMRLETSMARSLSVISTPSSC